MGETVKLRAADGFELSAYVARPEGAPLAGLVVVQEIFGVNTHIRSVADGYAKDGFLAVAPAASSIAFSRASSWSMRAKICRLP